MWIDLRKLVDGADNRSKTQQITTCIYCVLFLQTRQVPELIPVLISLPIEEQNRLFRGPVPRLPAIDVCPQLAHTFRCLGIRLQVFIAIPSGITCLARWVHQILGYCWPHRLLAAAAAQRDRQNRT